MNKLCKFHFQLRSNHPTQNTPHGICWLGGVFLSEGKKKSSHPRAPAEYGCVISDNKPLFQGGGGQRQPSCGCAQPSQPRCNMRTGQEPAKRIAAPPGIPVVKSWALGQSKQNISDSFLFQNTRVSPQARSNLVHPQHRSAANPAPLPMEWFGIL